MQNDRNALIGEIRRFTRFYTRTVGLLDETLVQSSFTLAEARVLFEIGHSQPRDRLSASDIAAELRLDQAYLARILRRLAGAGLTSTTPDPADGRRRLLSLTDKGGAALDGLQAGADRDIARLIRDLPEDRIGELRHALGQTMRMMTVGPGKQPNIALRAHRAGDLGWVIQRQAVLYTTEYGWNIEFEALVAEICAAFARDFRDDRDFCWIAELDGRPVGAVFLVHGDEAETAKLRLLHVEAEARGLGIGGQLVTACIEKARHLGYRRLALWTNDVLIEARRIYERAGFRLVEEEPHRSFGKDLVGQTWVLDL